MNEGKNDWPRYTEEEPETYEDDDLDTVFAACDAEERLWFEFFLMTGMREQEVMHATWSDINLNRAVVTVRYKREYGFSPKNYKERDLMKSGRQVWQSGSVKKKASRRGDQPYHFDFSIQAISKNHGFSIFLLQ